MKMVAEYLKMAEHFEQLAAEEKSEDFKANLLKQASAYRNLAIERAKNLGQPLPPQ